MESKIVARGIQIRKGRRNLLEERVMIGIRRYHDRIRRFVVRLSQPGDSPALWNCAISVFIEHGPQVEVTARAAGCEESVECAVHRLRERLRKTLGEKSPLHEFARKHLASFP